MKYLKMVLLILLIFSTETGDAQMTELEIILYTKDEINEFINVYAGDDIFIAPPEKNMPFVKFSVFGRIDEDEYIKNERHGYRGITGLDQYIGEYLGKIQRVGTYPDWKLGDATKLKKGTELYQHNMMPDFIIAVQDSQYIPYTLIAAPKYLKE